jgi:hypothetical protein
MHAIAEVAQLITLGVERSDDRDDRHLSPSRAVAAP